MQHSLSPLLMAIVCDHLGMDVNGKQLRMELVEVDSMTDALAWGYAGAVPSPVEWTYTQSVFGKFRTSALLSKAVEAARLVKRVAPSFLPAEGTVKPAPAASRARGLPTRMFEKEIWLNLTAPLKHQLVSSAVMSVDDSMETKSVNTLRWDGRGWWCGGFDGEGVVDVLRHHGVVPEKHVLGLHGGGGGARSTASAWAKLGGALTLLDSRRVLEEGIWSSALCDQPAYAVVDFDGRSTDSDKVLRLSATYGPMKGTVEERTTLLSDHHLDGRWLLVAQHLVCWRRLWSPERSDELPSLGLLMTKLVEAETVLGAYA